MKNATVILVIFLFCAANISCDVVVRLQQGLLRGTVLTSPRRNVSFFAFMGIPYAKAPVGNLRFKPPQSPEPWSGTREATTEGNVCPQINEFTHEPQGEEDCLFLNVYSKKLPSGRNLTLEPVMVSIHGGAFAFGSGNREVQGPDYLVEKGVVIVTMNYRLGVLGFLSLQNAELPGNNGLKDQVMALRWVQQNIAMFGGDPNKVTILGDSAGGASVHFHMVSPMSRGLFHRAIAQSGSMFDPWSLDSPQNSVKKVLSAAEALGINLTDPLLIFQEIKNFSLQQLRPANALILTFLPTIDAAEANQEERFLPDSPTNLVAAGRLLQVPFITGTTSSEGIVLLKALIASRGYLLRKYLDLLISQELGVSKDTSHYQEILSVVNEHYSGDATGLNGTLQQNVSMLSDLLFNKGIYCAASKQAQLSTLPVYVYEFDFSGHMNVFKEKYAGEMLPGAAHADDLPFLYRTTFHNRTFTEGSIDWAVSERMVKMWTNFAKTRNPTPKADPLLQNLTWSPITSTDFKFLRIDSNLSLQHHYKNGNINFWKELYRNYTTHSMCD